MNVCVWKTKQRLYHRFGMIDGQMLCSLSNPSKPFKGQVCFFFFLQFVMSRILNSADCFQGVFLIGKFLPMDNPYYINTSSRLSIHQVIRVIARKHYHVVVTLTGHLTNELNAQINNLNA